MSNHNCHKMAKKAMLKAGMNKNTRRYAHMCVDKILKGEGFDKWQLIEADKTMLRHGFDVWVVCPDELRRRWSEQPD